MSKSRLNLAVLVAAMALAAPAWAQTQAATSTNPSGSFQSLSPGNQKIVRALFEAQQPTAKGPAPLSLNQIAASKGSAGWGEVFKQMKSEGLVNAKNLGQVVSNYEHTTIHTQGGVHGTTPVVVTNGHGQSMTEGAGHPASASDSAHGHGDEVHEASATGVTTAGGATIAPSGSGVAHGGGGAAARAH